MPTQNGREPFYLISPLVSQSDNAPKFKGKYFGEKPPGLKAEIFNEGVLIGDKHSFNVSFSLDGKYLFFKRRQGKDRGIHWISTEIIENLKKKILKDYRNSIQNRTYTFSTGLFFHD